MSLQAKVLMHGGIVLCFHTLFKMSKAWGVIPLVPWCVNCTWALLLGKEKASLELHSPFLAGIHLSLSWLVEGTIWVLAMQFTAWSSNIWDMRSMSQEWLWGTQRSEMQWGSLWTVTGSLMWSWIEFHKAHQGVDQILDSPLWICRTQLVKEMFNLHDGRPKNGFTVIITHSPKRAIRIIFGFQYGS